MRNLTTFLFFGVFFVSAVSAQNTVVPIVYDETLLGGAQNGKWITAKKTDEQLGDKTEFNIINFRGINQIGTIFGAKAERRVCENPRIILNEKFETYNPDEYPNFALGANAKWNPVPRIPQTIGLTDEIHTKLVADFLKSKGLAKTKVEINQAYRVDLDDDGKDEILIAGYYYKTESSGKLNADDYSFVLLRKLDKGKPQNILIEGDFYTSKLLRSDKFDPMKMYKITAIADLNGDGKMEIVLWIIYSDGDRKEVFEMKNSKPIKVLETKC